MKVSAAHVPTDLCGGKDCPLNQAIFAKNLKQLCFDVSAFANAQFRTKLPDFHAAIQSYNFEHGFCCPIFLFPPFIFSGGFHMILNANEICKEKFGIIEKIIKHFGPQLEKIPAGELAPVHLLLGQLAIQSNNAPLLARIVGKVPLPKCALQAFLMDALMRKHCCVVKHLLDHGASPITTLQVDEESRYRPLDWAKVMDPIYGMYFSNSFRVDMVDANMAVLGMAISQAAKIDPTFLDPAKGTDSDYGLVVNLISIAPQDPRLALKLVKLYEPYISFENKGKSPLYWTLETLGHLLDHHSHIGPEAPRRDNIDHTAIILADTFLFAVIPLFRAGARLWESDFFDQECRFEPILSCIAKSKFKRTAGTFAEMMLESRSFVSKKIDLDNVDSEDRALISQHFPSLQLFTRRAILASLPIGIEKRLLAINELPLLSNRLKRYLNYSDFETQLRKISYHPDNEHPRHLDSGIMINPERNNATGPGHHALDDEEPIDPAAGALPFLVDEEAQESEAIEEAQFDDEDGDEEDEESGETSYFGCSLL